MRAVVVACVALVACRSTPSGSGTADLITAEPPTAPASASALASASATPAPSSSVKFFGLEPTEEELRSAPWVSLTPEHGILLDGVEVARTEGHETPPIRRIDALYMALKDRRDRWRVRNPGREFPGVIVLKADKGVIAIVVKSVFQTVAYAGYPNVGFVVNPEDEAAP